MTAELTVIVVSYNTRDLTLTCLRTLYENTVDTRFETVVFDNDSADGSADAIAAEFPQVRLIRSDENIGFAAANNVVAKTVETEWLLLLNPDTEVYSGAVDALLAFSKENPDAGITGGRTVFPDGSLNPSSCWRKITIWSVFCHAVGLTALFPRTNLFNPEGMGGWPRDTERQVDIVVGCFLMVPTQLWRRLGGFQERYFMYGEEADLCLRAAALGFRPMITPKAEIMHLVGASSAKRADKVVRVAKARATLIRDHWSRTLVPLGIGLLWTWAAVRVFGSHAAAMVKGGRAIEQRQGWRRIWSERHDWLRGY